MGIGQVPHGLLIDPVVMVLHFPFFFFALRWTMTTIYDLWNHGELFDDGLGLAVFLVLGFCFSG